MPTASQRPTLLAASGPAQNINQTETLRAQPGPREHADHPDTLYPAASLLGCTRPQEHSPCSTDPAAQTLQHRPCSTDPASQPRHAERGSDLWGKGTSRTHDTLI
ncbi:unnamed protein product [Pleuronectes platessa]|uniref:Uncharacterized protein n=1 Tax=Pleuronectes platessa TaxID=8262 RepID=A0A9N7TW83_PLEPL|nr:unnamed protein product [Pleuronectes platessa]